ncbi:MAG: hypothetical protein U0L34_02440 [Paludibacteraceae bacterium]|nr:hypothetical protein [Paludibacteraceae bacterium]
MKQLMPQFMRDNSQNDGHAETVMDYVISWCLRRADVICKDEKPILYSHCRFMLGKLLGRENIDDVIFSNVKVWKQWEKIDLRVEVDVEQMGKITKYALLIENKYYTGLHDATDDNGERRNQLEVYKKKFDAHYADKPNEDWKLHYALVTCLERESDSKFEQYRIAEEFDFNLFSFYELLENDTQTESDLFNEFWYRWGDPRF